MGENPYESPREAGYHTPQQPAIDAQAKDRTLLLVTGVVAYTAMMGFVGLCVLVKSYFPGRSDSAIKIAMAVVFSCVSFATFAVFRWGCKTNLVERRSDSPQSRGS